MIEAIKLAAEAEGMFLDPICMGKIMAVLIDLITKCHLKEEDKIAFFHTEELPRLFLYRNELHMY